MLPNPEPYWIHSVDSLVSARPETVLPGCNEREHEDTASRSQCLPCAIPLYGALKALPPAAAAEGGAITGTPPFSGLKYCAGLPGGSGGRRQVPDSCCAAAADAVASA